MACALPLYPFFENSWVELRRITVPIKDLPPAFEGYKLGLATDFHFPRRLTLDDLSANLALLAEEKPDVICIAGDLYDMRGEKDAPSLAPVLNRLSAPDGVLVTRGNHDWASPPENWAKVLDANVEVIEGIHKIVRRKGEVLCLAGIGDLWHDTIDLKSTLAGVPRSVPRILLSHNPDFAEDYTGPERLDLQLSGHLHGGQANLFGFCPYVPSKYDNKFIPGLVQGKSHLVFTSRGLTRAAGVRLNARPDVTLITLTSFG
ncbi:MAG: metallophosphoesterase [Fimbriimonadaceae bacterium]|nr:metallophosphoesterase [Fimbriimonadaceae bacterium]